MEQRVGFTLTTAQIQKACVAYVQDRLRDDEECKAVVSANGAGDAVEIVCEIVVSKKRPPKAKKTPA
jgi:hypothetical protein